MIEHELVRENSEEEIKISEYIDIKLQDGPIKENGINGCQIDNVIQYAIDTLQKFQEKDDGKYYCGENRKAILKLEEAVEWLRFRTKRRQIAGVEGTSKTTIEEGSN